VKTQAKETLLVLSQEDTDTLLEKVNQQQAEGSFNINDRENLKLLVECLGDTRGMTRLRAAETLGEIGTPATPFLLEALANHANVVVRRAAAKTLTLIADPTAVPNLVSALLNDEDTVVKGSAVGALARTGEVAVPALLEILSSPEQPESTKGHAAWALAFIGSEAKEYLYREIDSELPEVRCAVVGAIAKVAQDNPNETEAIDLLVRSLKDSSETVRSEAAAVLGNLSYKPAIPNLLELLRHPQGESRKAAALALMKIGEPSSIEPLQAALQQEPEASVQPIIKLAIGQIERKSQENDW
jgi:bilin biosynthesis protein